MLAEQPAQLVGLLELGHIASAPQSPPVAGPHSPVWQNSGFYSIPIANEHGVHSMEHGAVWITYRPELPASQGAALRTLPHKQSYVPINPYLGRRSSPRPLPPALPRGPAGARTGAGPGL